MHSILSFINSFPFPLSQRREAGVRFGIEVGEGWGGAFNSMFLHRIAQAFYTEYGADIRKFTFVFPNRRAGLFFRKYLMEIIERPIFSPEIITVTVCFFNASTRKMADRTAELFRLYRIYRKISRTSEDFDAFGFWGEMLLADFNDVDKYRVDASKLFKNVTELKEIDWSAEYLTEEQQKAIRHFWNHFLPTIDSKTKEEFIAIWKVLLPLYEQFTAELLSENTATEGMIFREVTELLKKNETPEYFTGKNFVFVGFNALTKTEQTLFVELQKRGQADFYWDYEAEELRDVDNQASLFYKANTNQFPSKLQIESKSTRLSEKSFELIAIPSAVGQTKEVYNLLAELYPENSSEKEWITTAVVLPDEGLLVPLLHSIPENIENVNITMGFPLKASPVSGLMENIFELQRRINSRGQFYHLVVSALLNHQYINTLCSNDAGNILQQMIKTNSVYVEGAVFEQNDILKTIFRKKNSPAEFIDYLLEVLQTLNLAWQHIANETGKHTLECDFLYQYYLTINRIREVMKSAGEFEMSLDTLIRLIRQLITGITIPFEGEPLNGLQVMGMLETRGLDFENLIICSFNEGVFPKKASSNSFIPNNLRRAFEMPTFEYQDAISAYNFYRLIQRTKRIYFLYDNRSEGMQTGEVSRFAHQLHYHYGVDFKQINISYDVSIQPESTITVHKSPEVLDKLNAYLMDGDEARALSASSLITYLLCPLKFYFTQIEGIKEQDEVQETLDGGNFGTILHDTMALLYEPYKGKFLEKSTLDDIRKNDFHIDSTINRAFAKSFYKQKQGADEPVELEGKNLLDARVIKNYIKQILKVDAERAPFKYLDGERPVKMQFPILAGAKNVNLKGFIDRLDEKEGALRILDYKTSKSDKLAFDSPDSLFLRSSEKLPRAIFQTFVYSLIALDEMGDRTIVPEIMKITDLYSSDFTSSIQDKSSNSAIDDFNDYKEDFTVKLTELIEEVFNPDIPFSQCDEVNNCKYCSFINICRREVAEY